MNNNIKKINIENKEEFDKWCMKLLVPKSAKNYSKFILDHINEFELRKKMKHDEYKENLPYHVQRKLNYEFHKKTSVLSIDVSEQQRKRAYLFMDYFIKAVEELGGSVDVDRINNDNDNTLIKFRYCTFECALFEKKEKYRNTESLTMKTMKPLYDIVYTGKFIFVIRIIDRECNYSNEYIYDENKKTLEDQIREIFANIQSVYSLARNKYLLEERERQEEFEKRHRQYKINLDKERELIAEKKKQELIEHQQKIIYEHLINWQRAKDIEAYISDILEYAKEQSQEVASLLIQYCDHVRLLFDKNSLINTLIDFTKKLEKP